MSTKNKKEYEQLFLEIIKKINKLPKGFIILKKLRVVHGWCDLENDCIEIDYRKELIPTLIHEMLHYMYPYWSETKVISNEKAIINNMTEFDVVILLKTFLKKIY